MRSTFDSPRDQGASLIIALVFMLVIGLVMGAILTFARGAFTTTINVAAERSTELNATNAATVAMQSVRRSFTEGIYSSTTGASCLPSGNLPDDPYSVWCVGTDAPGTLATRVVQFYVCATSANCVSTATSVVLYAVAIYDDVPPGATPPGYTACGTTATSTCGIQMSIATWDLKVNET